MTLTTAQIDRAVGALLATAAGDALGAPYEFQPPRGPELEVAMTGGGPWEPGEWTDDTSMAIAIAEIAATGVDLRDEHAQDAVVVRWHEWMHGAKDVGIQTSSVLRAAAHHGISAQTASAASVALHERSGRTAGNGSLMRTVPVALAYLDDEAALVEAARTVSELTHYDSDAGDACVLWCLAIRHAILTGLLDVRIGLRHLPPDQRDRWASLLDTAESLRPTDFPNNGWVVHALQAGWSAISTIPIPQNDPAAGVFRADHLRLGLDAAVRGGGDTDTVAAIAGGLLGAAYGASAVPAEWRRMLHGWPGIRTRDLVELASRTIGLEEADLGYREWTQTDEVVRHPYDDGVWLGGIGALRSLPDEVDTVVSLCRVSDADQPARAEQIDVRLIDRPGENTNLDFVLLDTVRVVEQLGREGGTVLIHCVQAQSRTPTVATLYGARLRGVAIAEALTDVCGILPNAHPIPEFTDALERLHPAPPYNEDGQGGTWFRRPGEVTSSPPPSGWRPTGIPTGSSPSTLGESGDLVPGTSGPPASVRDSSVLNEARSDKRVV